MPQFDPEAAKKFRAAADSLPEVPTTGLRPGHAAALNRDREAGRAELEAAAELAESSPIEEQGESR